MAKFADRVKVTVDSSTSGTGAVTLSTAVSGYQAVPSALDGASIRYVIELGTAWEIGLGVYTHSSLNLTRSLTSSSTGSLLSLNNTAVVFISPAAEDLQYVEVYSSTSDLPSASSNHGRIAHVHGDGAMYFAHAGNWVRLGNHSDITSYSNATTSADGLMSSADKTKLDGVATSANNYTLPTASSSTLGGIKIGSGLSIDGSGVVTASAGSAADATNYSVTSYTASAGSNTFDASSTPALPAYQAGKLAVYVNGVLQPASGYTATNGTSVVMTLAANDEVSIVNHGKLTGSILDLSDTPSSFGTAGQVLQVNSGTNALEFADAASGITTYADTDSLPETGNSAGDLAYVTANTSLYHHNGTDWYGVELSPLAADVALANSGDRGISAGGLSLTNVIDYFDIVSSSNATDFGDLTKNRKAISGLSNSTRVVFAGADSSAWNGIEYITTATTGDATSFGNTTASSFGSAACCDGTTGLFHLGNITNTIDKITVDTTGNASDFGDLNNTCRYSAGLADNNRGVFGGGQTVVNSAYQSLNVIDYVTIASAGNATDFGDLSAANYYSGAAADSTRGLFAGSQSAGNSIEYITIQTTGNSTDFGDLTAGRAGCAGAGNGTNACFFGGYDGVAGSTSNIIDKVVVQTLGNASDHGDLTVARNSLAGSSGAAS
jgi:hypothetical protein